jgi:hypothetical protein
MMYKLLGATAGAALLTMTSMAHASVITETYAFTLTNMTDIVGTEAAPYPTVTGSFTVTFDPEVYYYDDTTDIKVNSLSVPVGAPIGFSSYYDGVPGDPLFMSIGGVGTDGGYYNGVYYGDAGDIYNNSADFVLQLEFPNATSVNQPSLPICGQGYSCGDAPGSFLSSGYTIPTSGDAWLAKNGASLSGTVTAGVPEPATWAMMLIGFGGLGASLRNARRRQAAANAI